MFNPKTKIIEKIYSELKWPIEELENIFIKQTNVYIDYANVRPWSNRIGWNIDLKRLKQFLDSFNTINLVKFYSGTLVGNISSEKFIEE
ncbi:hypothetical protein L6278_00075, partial [Candidatus Parcubacteria bacterium]|nr:hypothetical protein [Patescibacteria group bacterium]MCG2686518.1 hypothetical protein [Candidatus Parcubacteria bacterium]